MMAPLPASTVIVHIWAVRHRTRRVHHTGAAARHPIVPAQRGFILPGAEAIFATRAQHRICDGPALFLHPGLTERRVGSQKALVLSVLFLVTTRHPLNVV